MMYNGLVDLLENIHNDDFAQTVHMLQGLRTSLQYIRENQLSPYILTIPSVLQMKMRKGNQDEQEADTMASSKTFQEILSKLLRMKRTDTFKSSLSLDSKELVGLVS